MRYHHSLWQELKPKVLQGVQTTLVLALPQIGFALAPHIQLEKVFLFLGSLARGMGPVQLFPARFCLFIIPDRPCIIADLFHGLTHREDAIGFVLRVG